MENQASSKNIILNYGLIYGIIAIIMSVGLYAANMHLSETGGLISIGVIALLIIIMPIVGMSKFKKDNMNLMSWGQGVKVGIGIVVIGTLLLILYNHLFTSVIEPDFNQQVLDQTREALENIDSLSNEQIDQQMAMREKFQGTLIGDAVGILFFTFIGFVISAIAAAVMKRSEEDGY